jgi:two-component system CheB/CheR fusion protein
MRPADLLDFAPVGIFETDAEGNCLYVNRRWCELAGMAPEQAMGTGWVAALHPDDRERVRREWYDAAAAGREFVSEYRFRTPDGRVTWLQGSAAGVRDESGNIAGFAGTLNDITDRRRAELELRAARAQLQYVTDTMPVFVARCSRERRFLWVNKGYAERFGYAPEDLPGRAIAEVIGDAACRLLDPYIERVLAGETVDFEVPIPYRGLAPQWMQAIYTPTRDDAGVADGWIAGVVDISGRKEIEVALARQVAELQAIYETAPVGIMVTEDRECRVLSCNRALAEMVGMPFGENISKSRIDAENVPYVVYKDGTLVPPELLPMQRSVAEGIEVRGEIVEVVRDDGGRVTMLINATPLRDESGAVTGAVGVCVDVTTLRAAEDALRESEGRFARFMQHLPGLAWIKDAEGRYVFANDAAQAAFQMPSERLYGRTDEEVFSPETAVRFRENDRRALAAGAGIQEVELLEQADGIVHRSLVSKFPIPGVGGAPVLVGGMAIDITERFQAEEALRESERRFQLALASGAVTVFEQDLELRYTWVYPQDPAFPEHNIGRSDDELLPGGAGTELMEYKRQVIETGRGARRTVHVVLPSGDWYYDLIVEPRYDAAGRIVGVGGAALDVTARKLVEESLKDADRRKDEFLATLAHELRNPLAPIANSVQLLRLAGARDPELEVVHDIIDRQVRQLTRLVEDLLDVSRVSRGKITLHRQRIKLESVVEQAVETTRPLFEAVGHKLVVSLPGHALTVDGDPTRLAQAFGNLLHNAAKFTTGTGRIAVEATREGDWAKIVVRDNGLGIPADMLSRIFELFAQVETGVDRAHGGLGIGLTLVRSLVELHGGTIEAQSDGPGRGSAFVVRLPLAAEVAPEDHADRPGSGAEDRAARRCRILVVDDNVDSAVTLARLLGLVGHEVKAAHDGPGALEAAAAFRPDVMLVDLGMPGMSGFEVAGRIRAHPELAETRLIALTGWGQPEDRVRTRQAGFDRHLVKPVDFKVLQALIAEWAEGNCAGG